MTEYRLFCLGNPSLEFDGQPVRLETRKGLAMLIYLRMAGHDCPRESLQTLFWPEYDQKHAQANLRRTLASLNKSLRKGIIEADRERVGIKDPSNIWLDVAKFLEKLASRKSHPHPQDEICVECRIALDEAIQLYQGDFLEGFNLNDCSEFDEWQFLQRETLRQELGLALQKITEALASRSQWKEAINHAHRWVSLDRLNEPACRTLMDLYARSGQRAAALHQYEELRSLLKEQLNQEPEHETHQLYEQIWGREEAIRVSESPESTRSFPLLKTKLYIPSPPGNRVIRSGLIGRLGEAERKALTIISAPAGFGKTTLLAEWIAQTSLPVAWLALDNGDNDLYRFLDYVIAALESIQENMGLEARQIMRSLQPVSKHIILASLINDLGKVVEPYALVLDDYQFITEQAVHDAVGYLLDHLPVNVHIVISTRADPPLQLGRLRAHSRLLELRTQDLRFNTEEANQFLNTVMRLGLSMGDIEALQERTEGWVVGLKMAALSLLGRSDISDFIQAFSGSHRYVLDYLVEEVLKRQPAHIKTFLLETSILEKMNGSLCDALMTEEWRKSGENGQSVLEYLEKSNLFLIPLDENKQWYRYHHLFSDLLQSRLQQFSAGKANALHQRASQWFENRGMLHDAIDHALKAKDFQRTADLVDKIAQTSILIDVFPVQKWIDQIPDEIIFEHPWICVTQSWIWIVMGKLGRIEEYLCTAEDCISRGETQWMNDIEKQDIRGHIAMLRAYFAFFRGNPGVTIEQATYALKNVRASNIFLRCRIALQLGESYSIIGELEKGIQYLNDALSLSLEGFDYSVATVAFFRLGMVLKIQGRLTEAENIYKTNFQILKEMGGSETSLCGKPEIGLGDLLRERGQLEEAFKILTLGHNHSEMQGQPYDLIYSYIFLARLLQAQGKLEQALEFLSEAEPLFVTYTIPPVVRLTFVSCQVNLWIKTGNLRQAELWMNNSQLNSNIDINYQNETGLILLSRVLISQGKLVEAQELLNRLVTAAESAGRNGRLIEMLALLSLTFQAAGMKAKAKRYLTKALLLAEPEGYRQIFLDEGEPMIKLLEEMQNSKLIAQLKDYVNRLLETSI